MAGAGFGRAVSRRRRVPLGLRADRGVSRAVPLLAIVILAAGVLAAVMLRDDDPPSLDDYCGPPPTIVDLAPMITDEPVAVGFESLGKVDEAVAVAEGPGGTLFVAARDGRLWRLAPGVQPDVVLDLRDEIVTDSLEQGLLGVAVRPDGSAVYVHGTFTDGTATILEYHLTAGVVDPSTRRVLFSEHDPAATHNGGRIAFGADGMLYIGLGDGGDGALTGAAQDLASPFGKLLRIDPTPSGGRPYTIPADNPFVGVDGARPEVWSYGFRNPWGWSLDAATGDLWVGDVGQLCFEEIDHAADGGAGSNFGWSYVEGAHTFEGPILGVGGEPDTSREVPDLGPRPKGLTAPVYEYRHGASRCAVIGGAVYRGADLPVLAGRYLWADLCDGTIRTLRQVDGAWRLGRLVGEVPAGLGAFGQATDGGIYLVSMSDGIFRLTAPSR